jgi:hypothetical protein
MFLTTFVAMLAKTICFEIKTVFYLFLTLLIPRFIIFYWDFVKASRTFYKNIPFIISRIGFLVFLKELGKGGVFLMDVAAFVAIFASSFVMVIVTRLCFIHPLLQTHSFASPFLLFSFSFGLNIHILWIGVFSN